MFLPDCAYLYVCIICVGSNYNILIITTLASAKRKKINPYKPLLQFNILHNGYCKRSIFNTNTNNES